MIEEQVHQQEKLKQAAKVVTDSLSTSKRRRLLKGAVALPVIMTLHSGAALARTSNLVGKASAVSDAQIIIDENGERLLCVYPDTTQDQIPGSSYDLGPMPQGNYEQNVDSSGQFISLPDQSNNCEQRGGIVISAIAFTSLMSKSNVSINNTTW